MSQYAFDGVIFDLDGVITKTALVHAKAWKAAFDEYLRMREKRDKEPFREFTHEADYLPYVDGKPRYKGVKSFLESRGVTIPFGDPTDSPEKETVCGIGNKKNAMFREVLEREGAEVFESTITFIKALKAKGVPIGVASSSKNCKAILKSAEIETFFETRVDGEVSAKIGLKGKPEADIFVTACRNIGVQPARSIVVEDASSGVQAGRNGGFGLVLGVARENNEPDLIKNGADLVVRDLADIGLPFIEQWFQKKPVPLFKAWENPPQLKLPETKNKIIVNPMYARSGSSAFLRDKRLIFFLDYDGTLSPIVERPELAVLSKEMREVLMQLSKKHTVAIVSGRMKDDVMKLVSIDGLFFAGSHGFDITGPGFSIIQPKAKEAIPLISRLVNVLKEKLGSLEGLLIEEKKFSVAVHYRLVDEHRLPEIRYVVEKIAGENRELHLMSGKKVLELLPDIDWDKGKAIRWIMESLKVSWNDASVIYIGDDVTDEYAFRAIRTRGTGILVSEEPRQSAADFRIASTDDVKKLFKKILSF